MSAKIACPFRALTCRNFPEVIPNILLQILVWQCRQHKSVFIAEELFVVAASCPSERRVLCQWCEIFPSVVFILDQVEFMQSISWRAFDERTLTMLLCVVLSGSMQTCCNTPSMHIGFRCWNRTRRRVGSKCNGQWWLFWPILLVMPQLENMGNLIFASFSRCFAVEN